MSCGVCGTEKHEDGSPVTWQCQVCEKKVCRDCTLLIKNFDGSLRIPHEYYEMTLCSDACWEAAGKPVE